MGEGLWRRSAAKTDSRVMWFQNRVVNPVVRAVLRSPLHRMLSGSVLLLSYRGRRTGRTHTLPVQYAAWGDDRLVVWPAFPERKHWWRNFLDIATAEIRIRGSAQTATAHVVDGEDPVRSAAAGAYRERFPKAGTRLAEADAANAPLVVFELQRTRSA